MRLKHLLPVSPFLHPTYNHQQSQQECLCQLDDNDDDDGSDCEYKGIVGQQLPFLSVLLLLFHVYYYHTLHTTSDKTIARLSYTVSTIILVQTVTYQALARPPMHTWIISVAKTLLHKLHASFTSWGQSYLCVMYILEEACKIGWLVGLKLTFFIQ